MEITIKFPDKIGKKIKRLSNPDEFVTNVVQEALENKSSQKKPSSSKSSRWAKIAQRVQNDPIHLEGYSQQLKGDMRGFRDSFEFANEK